MKFSPSNGYKFDRGDVKGRAYSTKADFSRMSAAIFVVKGEHPKMKSINSDRLYFVLRGHGVFDINDEKITVKEKDVVIVPKNTPYSYEGDMECFLVHSPAFDREKEIRYEEDL